MEGWFRTSRHFDERCVRRQVTIVDVSIAFARCRSVEPFDEPARHDGTCWRAYGSNVDGTKEIAVGFEAFIGDGDQEEIVLCTVLPPREKR
jgi:hypothetical protein